MWTGRAFHPKSYIVQRRERDVATRLSKFIDIDDSNQSTPSVIRSKVAEIDKRKTRTSGNMESEEWTCGFFEEKIMPRRHLEEGSLTLMGQRVDRAQTAPVNVEALQSAAAAYGWVWARQRLHEWCGMPPFNAGLSGSH